jgi:hypothetical protein
VRILTLTVVTLATLSACKRKHEPQPRSTGSGSSAVASGSATGGDAKNQVSRADFNRLAVHLNLPVFWIADTDNDATLDPDEVAPLLFYPTSATAQWVAGGAFTPAFDKAYSDIIAAAKAPAPDTSSEDGKRRALVIQDLDAGRPTLIYTDLSQAPDADKELARHMLKLASMIDDLYETMKGATALASRLPADVESRSLFRRNRGPHCEAPRTATNPACSAIPGAPPVIFDIYPAALQANANFCKDLAARKDGSKLMGHFNVVRGSGDALEAVPYSVAYATQMGAIAKELTDTAALINDPAEAALVAYLNAAAKAFTTNDWNPADEAWAKMGVDNSKWYVRIGPDETYWEPCAEKGGMHLAFARINQASIAWQQKLKPLQQDMERAIAARAGAPYKARTVTFKLPDFIDVILNAGDDRDALVTTLGQSLPNWGPLVDRGAGRTWAALNVSDAPDTRAARLKQASAVFDKETMALYPPNQEPDTLSTMLHEATHNLGPAYDYKVGGKVDSQAFGGPLAAMLEELKAQTGALFLVELLRSKGMISDEFARQSYFYALVWACGHISQGMYTSTHGSKAYGQLAAIQLGYLTDKGALTFDPNKLAANGTDKGAFTLHADKMPAVADEMMKDIAGIKARGDRAAAEALVAKYVDSSAVVPHELITERFLREPRYSHVYSLKL